MKKTETRQVSSEVITHLVCDACGLEAPMEGGFEAQEFLRYSAIGGFDSIFGDGHHINLDICQRCIKERLGDVIRVTPPRHYTQIEEG
jgi:hypothetical protein